jgi:predicted anti-sigma-YlaC factor YlaD
MSRVDKMNKTNIDEFLSCRKVEEFLMTYIDRELNIRSRLRFQFHLAMCSDCRNYFQEYKNSVALGKQVFSKPDELAAGKVPDEILHAIIDASRLSS